MALQDIHNALEAGDISALRTLLADLDEEENAQLEIELGAHSYALVRDSVREGRSRRKNGKVILLHGIMGAELCVEKGGDRDGVWINYLRLFNGRLRDLRLSLVEQAPPPGTKVMATRQMKKFYLPPLLKLDESWDVRPFAYDWREDIRKSADRLAELVRSFGAGQPLHLVAHSMGGLVCRSFMARHAELWEQCGRSVGLRAGGRLVQLGTPNHGSYTIPRVLTGEESQVRKLAKLDRKHSLNDVLRFTNTFPGSYQMLPAHWVESTPAAMYSRPTWGGHPVHLALLDDARRFQDEIRPIVDPERFVYVAGYDRPTPSGARTDRGTVWKFDWTRLGDGRVTHELGLLDGVRARFVDETHGDLPRNIQVLRSLDELLLTGTTSRLRSSPRVTRSVTPMEVEALTHDRALEEIERLIAPDVARSRGRAKEPTESQLTAAEQARVEALLLVDETSIELEEVAVPDDGVVEAPAVEPSSLVVDVVWGDVTRTDADLYAVGHYEGVMPQNALRAIDRSLSGDVDDENQHVLRRQILSGNLSGDLGRVTFYPWGDATLAILGMDRAGDFTPDYLSTVARRFASMAVDLYPGSDIASVLIGSGEGTLSLQEAVSGLIRGFSQLADQGRLGGRVKRLQIVELVRGKAEEIHRELAQLAKSYGEQGRNLVIETADEFLVGEGGIVEVKDVLEGILRLATQSDGAPSGAAGRHLQGLVAGLKETDASGADAIDAAIRGAAERAHRERSGAASVGWLPEPIRMTFLHTSTGISVSAITESSTVSERRLSFDFGILDELVERVRTSEQESVDKYARTLTRLLLPGEFRKWIASSRTNPIVFEVDREMAQVHWEMIERGDGPEFLAQRVQVARQFRTSYSPPPSRASLRAGQRRALVVGDPGDPKEGDQLEGARREALAVARVMVERGVDVTLLIGAPNAPHDPVVRFGTTRLPCRPATRADLLTELLSEDYDILHYAGHAGFDDDRPDRDAGWVFARGLFSAAELSRVETLPTLVVANACLSARTSATSAQVEGRPALDEGLLLPSLADEFFRQGARHYVGTAWEVSDVGAVQFAETFYERIFSPGVTIGEAMLEARRDLYDRRDWYGHLWAAYQHYGNPNDRPFLRP